MKKQRFTEEQIIAVLKEQEAGMKVAEAPSLNGQRIIIISGHTHRSVIRHRHATPELSPQPAPTLRNMKAWRFHRLLPTRQLAYSKPRRL